MKSGFQKCLELAEKIIQALDDPEIFSRYQTIKAKCYAKVETKSTQRLQHISSENQIIQQRISQISSEQNSSSDVSSWAVSELHALGKKYLPTAQPLPQNSPEEAMNFVYEVVQTQVASHLFLRDKITSENQSILQQLTDIRNKMVQDGDTSRRTRIEAESKWSEKKQKMKEYVVKIEEQISAKEQEYENAILENTQLSQFSVQHHEQHEQSSSCIDTLNSKLNDLEIKHKNLTRERDKLLSQLQQIKYQISELRKHPVAPTSSDPQKIEEELQMQVDDLIAENNRLKKQLHLN